jgi:hypothetical protein
MASASDFNAAWYLQQNPDVAKAGVDPYQHFQQYGISEGRAPNQTIYNAASGHGALEFGSDGYNFNMFGANSPVGHTGGLLGDYGSTYLQQNPDVAAAVKSGQIGSALDHYNQFGKAEGRDWGTGYTNSINPTTGAATFGGPSYAATKSFADQVSGAGGGAPTGGGGGMGGAPTGGLGGLGGFDMNQFLSGWQQQQQQAQQFQQQMMQQQNQSMTDMMSKWQQGFSAQPSPGAQQGSTYNPTGVGGSFSNVTSPVYRPGGESDGNKAPVNGFGGAWGGNGPFRPSF